MLLLLIINVIFLGIIMGIVEDIQGSISELNGAIAAVDLKLDDVRAFIVSLQGASSGATAEQLQQILDGVNAAKVAAAAVLAEATALPEQP